MPRPSSHFRHTPSLTPSMLRRAPASTALNK
jgi:hypothetical protein